MDKVLRRPQWLIAAGVFVLTLIVYVVTLNPTTPFWDCGEFITTSHIVGVPHQPGTPLYVLVGRVFDIVFGQADITTASYTTAWAVNFMSAFFSALAVMFVYLIIWELSRRADPDAGWLAHVGGVVGAFFLAFSETFWNSAVEAEVYGLSAFMMALLSWLAIRWYERREDQASNQILLLMVYLLGLGVGFHLGSILVYPGVFLLVVLAKRRHIPLVDLVLISIGLGIFLFSTTFRTGDTFDGSEIKKETVLLVGMVFYLALVILRAVQNHRFALYGSLLFLVGLSVHFIMIIRAGADPEPFINQTAPDNFETLMSVIRREQYPTINPFERRAPLLWQYGYYYGFLFKQFYILGPGHGMLTTVTTVLGPIFLALVGLFQGLRRLVPLILVPLINYLINGEILTMYLNFTSSEVRDRDYFYFAAFMFFAIFIGLGASALLRYAAGGEGKSAEEADDEGTDWRSAIPRVKLNTLTKVAAVVLLVVSLLPITPGHTKFFEHDNSDNWIAYEYAWNILAGLDEDAIVFTNGDNDTFPIWYLQEVEKFRTDVTVVNLSLVNLPWYVKQLRNHPEKPLAMQRDDKAIDELRHRVFEDPNTGERTVLMIKDYVVHDIITTNHADKALPVFFAVTIPTENMERYFANLQMEGMAYRLMGEASPEGVPTTDADKVMENMLGVYRVGALMTGDTPERQARFREMVGLASDVNVQPFDRGSRQLSKADMDTLSRLYGDPRDDVFRNTNARHLLGNYPAAFNRAGYEYYLRANQAREDTVAYRDNIRRSITAFEAGLTVAPYNDLAMDYYPLLLVQDYRDQDAKDFLSSLAGNLTPEVEERVVVNTIRGIVGGGVPELAKDWLAERIEDEPDRAFYYRLQFQVFQALGDLAGARETAETWERRTGEKDPDMERGLAEIRQRSLDREQERIDGALERSQEPKEDDGR